MVPFDKKNPFITSGIRIGTPAVTTRNMGKDEMIKIVEFIDQIINDPENSSVIDKVKQDVFNLCHSFPLYNELH